jgi:hypothetical protein
LDLFIKQLLLASDTQFKAFLNMALNSIFDYEIADFVHSGVNETAGMKNDP